mmetsp:Transcript_7984/g.32958  ORF Transcript_7984/g.32958 Transcript_7984/m.32958 type:complete len:218 (-) Transcript_7984:280-933(-)
MRHFIDSAFLATVDTLSELRVVPAVPPCATLTGTKRTDGERVLGMLAEPLAVTVKTRGGDDEPAHRIDLALDGVLVVDALPVPLHVSIKALQAAAEGDPVQAEALAAISGLCGCGDPRAREAPFAATSFPEAYRAHPFWTNDSMMYIGLSDNYESYAAGLQAARGDGDDARARACRLCGRTKSLKRCGRCRKVWYCGADCQRADWQDHHAYCVERSA